MQLRLGEANVERKNENGRHGTSLFELPPWRQTRQTRAWLRAPSSTPFGRKAAAMTRRSGIHLGCETGPLLSGSREGCR